MLRAFWAYDAAAESDLADVCELDPTAFTADIMGVYVFLTEQPLIAGCD
jgi:hypothetical protein